MKEKQLQPIKVNPKFDEDLEKEILLFFYKNIFAPLLEGVRTKEIKKTFFNSKNDIESAIRSGKIQFSDGVFRGSFNAAIAKEFKSLGLKFDKRIGGYRKDLLNLPASIQVAIAQAESKYKLLASETIRKIDSIDYAEGLKDINFSDSYQKVIDNIDNNFIKTVNDVIGVKIDLTPEQKAIIAEEYSNNLKLYIKDFSDDLLPLLREDVELAVFRGIRADSLEEILIKRSGFTRNKAKFLAKQEISLLTSKYKESKYQSAGIKKYKWSTSKDSRVRQDHKDLDGKIFSFDDPPIENKDTGNRANAGEPFGCRCIAIPIIEV